MRVDSLIFFSKSLWNILKKFRFKVFSKNFECKVTFDSFVVSDSIPEEGSLPDCWAGTVEDPSPRHTNNINKSLPELSSVFCVLTFHNI